MNRTVIGWALFLLAFAVALMVSPLALTGVEQLTPLAEVGVFIIPVAVVVAFMGGLSPDPDRLTVGGALGNPDENEIRAGRHRPAHEPAGNGGWSPREPVNCRHCYTLVNWDEWVCSRCTTPRLCRECGSDLDRADSTIRCLRCGRSELLCRCAPMARASAPSDHLRRRAVR